MRSIREDIKAWSEINNGNPLDDERLYDIVLKTIKQRCNDTDFYDVIEDKNKAEVSFKRYEDLHCFAKYLECKGYLNLEVEEEQTHPKPSVLFHETSH